MTSAAIAVAACLAIGAGDDQILVRDISSAWERGAVLPLETPLGLAPAPGVERRFDLAELNRLAARFGLPTPSREVCVARPTAPPDPAKLLAAMRAALPDARIELVDYSRYPAPDGVLEFSPSGLHDGAPSAFWSGSIRYGGSHRAPVWARVHVTAAVTRVVAARDIPAGAMIDADALRLAARDEFPSAEPAPKSVDEAAGRVARRLIRAGDTIRAASLDRPREVTRGETVDVEVRSGAALLRFPGQALASGALGQTILVRNPETRRTFTGRVEARGKVTVGVAR